MVQGYANRIMSSYRGCLKLVQRQLVLRSVVTNVAPRLEFGGKEKDVGLNMVNKPMTEVACTFPLVLM